MTCFGNMVLVTIFVSNGGLAKAAFQMAGELPLNNRQLLWVGPLSIRHLLWVGLLNIR